MRALAFEHLESDPVGVFGDVLTERGIGVDRVKLHAGEPVPDWREYDLIVAMGAGQSVWQEDEFPWIVDEKRAVREAVLAGTPYFGICFGVQLLADVFGGQSFPGPEPEIGVNQVFLTPAAHHDPVFRGFPADLEVCEWHSNHFSLPPGAIRLARSPRYENQAIRYGRVAYGMQCHLEPSLQDIRDWLEAFPQTAIQFEQRHGKGSVARLLDDYEDFVPFLQETARQVFGRWLQNAITLRTSSRPRAAIRPASEAQGPRLFGRDAELSRIDAAIASARQGQSAVVVLQGEPGTGKTTLIDAAARRAHGLRVLRCGPGDAGERELPFAALAALCRPLADHRRDLTEERERAITAVLESEVSAGVEDRFAVYVAAFDLLVAAAAEAPLLVAVDDAHLLDVASQEALAFIARRLGSDGITVLVASESDDELAFAAALRLRALEPHDAHALLEHRWSGELAPPVASAVVSAAGGNPLALTEIPADLSPAERAGEAALEKPLPASAEWVFLSRIQALPEEVRQALVVAALAGPHERDAIPEACRTLGLDDAALERNGLTRRDGDGITFVHPLARIAVSYSALRADRRAAHAALAAATSGDPSTWHRARAATHPDEAIAAALEQIARAARRVTAFAAAAAAFERAARLTPAADARARRLLEASRDAHLAGHVNASLDHVDAALRHAETGLLRQQAEHVRGRILARSGSAEGARDQLVSAAARCEQTEPALAAEMLAEAVLPGLRAGDPAGALRLAQRALGLSCEDSNARGPSLTVEVALGTALIFAGEYQEGGARLDRAQLRVAHATDLQQLAYLGAGLGLAGRHAVARAVLVKVIEEARALGAISLLPYALIRLADVDLETGRWDAAAAALNEALTLARETGQQADAGLALGSLGWLAGARGLAEECQAAVQEAVALADLLGGGSRLDRAGTAIGLLELGRGRPEHAVPHLEAACRLQDAHGWSDSARTPHRRPDLVEAYALAGRLEDAREAVERFGLDAARTGRPSALAALARCRALLAGDGEIDAAFAAARDAAVGAAGPFEQARTELLHGLSLVRIGAGGNAVDALGGALTTFERLGAQSWAERAREALVSAGGSPPPPSIAIAERLTPRELEVVLAAGDGSTPTQIAERLFLGPRTVQMQLASAAIKLGLQSPAALGDLLRDAAPDISAVA